MDDMAVIEELKRHLLPGKKYKAFMFLEIGKAAVVFERLAKNGFSSFVVQNQQSPEATALAVEVRDRTQETSFERLLEQLAREGLVYIGLNRRDSNFR